MRSARSAQDAEDAPMASSKRTPKAGKSEPTKKRAGPISLHGLDFDDVIRRMLNTKPPVRPKRPKRRAVEKKP